MTTPASGVRNSGIKAAVVVEWGVRVFALMAPVMFGILVGVAISAERRLDSHEIDLAGIEASRFTAQDGADIQRQLGQMVTRDELGVIVDRWTDEFRELRRSIERLSK